MSEVLPNVLARWLVLHGYAEDTRGHGHVTGDELAEALLATYEIRHRYVERRPFWKKHFGITDSTQETA